MSIQQALKTIATIETLQPVYCIQGSESYLQQKVKEAFLQRMAITENDLNFTQIDLELLTVDQLIDEAETVPFFGDQRLLFAMNPYFLTSEKKNNGPDHNLDRLLEYLNSPLQTTVLVFFAPYDKFDERKKITKNLKKQAVLIDTKPLAEKEVKRMVHEKLKQANVDIEPQALEQFLRSTEMDLSKAMHELEKLILFASATGRITVKAVEQLIPKTLENNVFELTEMILKGKADGALEGYRELLLQGEETIKINAILIGQIRLYLQVAILMEQGMQQGAIADQVKAHPYRVKLAMQQSRKYSRSELEELFDQLVENDYKMKTGQMTKEYLFELFILQTANRLVGR